MTFSHALMDGCLWFIAFLWFCGFVRSVGNFRREHRRLRRIRQLGPPSRDCNRMGDYEVQMGGFGRRQAD